MEGVTHFRGLVETAKISRLTRCDHAIETIRGHQWVYELLSVVCSPRQHVSEFEPGPTQVIFVLHCVSEIGNRSEAQQGLRVSDGKNHQQSVGIVRRVCAR